MNLTVNVHPANSIDTLLELDVSLIKNLALFVSTDRDDVRLGFESITHIKPLRNDTRLMYGLEIEGLLSGVKINTTVIVPVHEISSIEVVMKQTPEQQDDLCTCNDMCMNEVFEGLSLNTEDDDDDMSDETPNDDAGSDDVEDAPNTEAENDIDTSNVNTSNADTAKLAEQASRLKEAFGSTVGSSSNVSAPAASAQDTSAQTAAPAQDTSKTAEPTAEKTEPKPKTEPKKVVHIKRHPADDRFYVGPNFTSAKNRLGEGRLKKIIAQILDTENGQKITMTFRNTPVGDYNGSGVIKHGFYDKGLNARAKVGIEGIGINGHEFGSTIITKDDTIDDKVMELIIFEK